MNIAAVRKNQILEIHGYVRRIGRFEGDCVSCFGALYTIKLYSSV
jgi:hypothetical protein